MHWVVLCWLCVVGEEGFEGGLERAGLFGVEPVACALDFGEFCV